VERFDLILDADAPAAEEAGPSAFRFASAPVAAPLPRHEDVADPEAGWAARNPARAMAFLYVSPRDCGAVDELLAR
jgi:hypothetical protein